MIDQSVPRCEYAIYVKALIKRQEGQAQGEKLFFVKSVATFKMFVDRAGRHFEALLALES